MTTTNQKLVADAIATARNFGFEAGFRELSTAKKNWIVTRGWFAEKCAEHNIPLPIPEWMNRNHPDLTEPSAVKRVFSEISSGAKKVKTEFELFSEFLDQTKRNDAG